MANDGIRDFERAKSALRRLIATERDPQRKEDLKYILQCIQDGEFVVAQRIWSAKMIGARNPSFDGDMIGWLNDDFSD